MTEGQRRYLRRWQAANPEKVRAYRRTNYLQHRRRKLRKHAEWRKNNPEYMRRYQVLNANELLWKARNRWYLRKYGISLAQYETMFKRQKGRCGLCRKRTKKHLAVDHEHTTGRIRGLLCTPCNYFVVGRVDSDPLYLKRLIAYVD